MSESRNVLSDHACKTAKPGRGVLKKFDGGGLYLLVRPTGTKLWQMAYRYDGKPKTLSFGPYPVVSLSAAREKRDNAKVMLGQGLDPRLTGVDAEPVVAEDRRFETVARRWFATNAPTWVPKHAGIVRRRLETDVFPKLGTRPIDAITSPEVMAVLRAVEDRGSLDVVRRLRQTISAIFGFAIAEGAATVDPASTQITKALKPKPKVRHMRKLTIEQLPEFFARLRDYDGEEQTALALELTLRTALRTKEVRFAPSKGEMKNDLWVIPGPRMKERLDHIVPLFEPTKRIIARLVEIGGGSPLLVPGDKPGQPISENTMLFALYRMGYHSKATVHGFRGTFSTAANESGLWQKDWIERQLAHVEVNTVRDAYNAAEYLAQRTEMMKWWSDLLDTQKSVSDLL